MPPSRIRSFVLAALVVVGGGALVGVLVQPSSTPSSASASSLAGPLPAGPSPSVTAAAPAPTAPPPEVRPRRAPAGRLGADDGLVADGVTVFDDVPAVANLDPGLLGAHRRAATDAADDRVTIYVNSGWRSAAYQEQLLQEAVSKYGSPAAAARWVATPETSEHVSGDAVDVGHAGAETWLSRHGAEYGLCQIYRNEPWHYELRPDAVDHGCPHPYADPTQDPRLQ
jgi:hypothetical protein